MNSGTASRICSRLNLPTSEPLPPGAKDQHVSIVAQPDPVSSRQAEIACSSSLESRWAPGIHLHRHNGVSCLSIPQHMRQQDCDITSTTASSPEHLMPKDRLQRSLLAVPSGPYGHPEKPVLVGARRSPSIPNVLDDLTVSSIPSLLCHLVYQLGMAAGMTDDVFVTFIVIDQHSTFGTSTHAGNSRAINPCNDRLA